METFALSRFGLTISAAAALLAACGGSQPPMSTPGAMQQRSGITASESHGDQLPPCIASCRYRTTGCCTDFATAAGAARSHRRACST